MWLIIQGKKKTHILSHMDCFFQETNLGQSRFLKYRWKVFMWFRSSNLESILCSQNGNTSIIAAMIIILLFDWIVIYNMYE